MQSDTFSPRSRLQEAFRRAHLVSTPVSLLRIFVEALIFVGTAYLAIFVTGLMPFFDAFCAAHPVLLGKTIVVAFVIYPFFHVLGMCVMGIIKGFFASPSLVGENCRDIRAKRTL